MKPAGSWTQGMNHPTRHPLVAQAVTAMGAMTLMVPVALAEISLTDRQGRQATVEILEATPENLSLRLQGKKTSVAMADLAEKSQAEVIAYAKEKGIYRTCPPLNVQVKIARQQRNSDTTWYQKNVRITASAVIEGVNKLAAIPAIEATVLLVTQDTRQKYVKREEKLTVHLTDRIAIPAANSGERREFAFQTLELTMDSARDTSNLGGNEYKYFVFGLRDAETGQFLDFQTNCPSLQTYVASHPEARATVLSARKNASFSTDFAAK